MGFKALPNGSKGPAEISGEKNLLCVNVLASACTVRLLCDSCLHVLVCLFVFLHSSHGIILICRSPLPPLQLLLPQLIIPRQHLHPPFPSSISSTPSTSPLVISFSAYNPGRIKRGDILVAINGFYLTDMCFNDVISLLKVQNSPFIYLRFLRWSYYEERNEGTDAT